MKEDSWKKRMSHTKKVMAQLMREKSNEIYLNNKWISFTGKSNKNKLMNSNKFDYSESASTAVVRFRKSGKKIGIFPVHTRMNKDKKREGNMYHANVLIYKEKQAYYYNPFRVKMTRLPRLVPAILNRLHVTKQVRCITGPQYSNTTTCVIHAFQFMKRYVDINTMNNLEKEKAYYEM